MGEQLVPASEADFHRDRDSLVALLHAVKPDITRVYHAFNPYPWALAASEVAALEGLLQCVRRALCATVEHYFEDPRLQTMLALSEDETGLLRAASRHPYRPGAFRPDFLHEAGGGIRISEINARFCLNGFLLSYALDAAMRKVPYRHRLPVVFDGIPRLAEVPGVWREAFGESTRILVLKGQERGYDIRLFMDYWTGCHEVRPEDAVGLGTETDFVILELHQHELLERLPRAVLLALIEKGRYINDIRTILLGHDKRLLAVFTSDVLGQYLAAEDLDCLHRHVVPTHVVGSGGEALRLARERPREWILKPNLLGKGEGIVMGRSVAPEAWHAAVDAAHPHHVLQPYVEQRPCNVLVDVQGAVQTVAMKVVGLLPAFNDRFLGPGIYRASQGDIVNVSGGGTILAPVVVAPQPLAPAAQGRSHGSP